ncbi:unnamed protein product [Owenia fusiformis]|uniref:Uncharacterized protein n=1 Tax=Owenia fusiformis TaxID=6347 RepID=A0A8J1XMB9_OWEFU|nr:unnamed protein product [Owenia fusiformis]
MWIKIFMLWLIMSKDFVSMEDAKNLTMLDSSQRIFIPSEELMNPTEMYLDTSTFTEFKSTATMPSDSAETATFNQSSTNASFILEGLRPKVGVTEMLVHTVLEFFIALVMCLGNIVVLLAVWHHRSLHTVTNIFIVSLSVSDLCMGLFASPLSIIDNYITPLIYGSHVQNKWLCAFKIFCLAISGGGSLLSLFGIAVDRYIAVMHPMKYHTMMTHTRVGVLLGCMWLICFSSSVIIFAPDVMMFKPQDLCRTDEVLNETYANFMKVIVGIFFILTSSLHIMVSLVAWKHRKRIASELAVFNNNMAVAYRKENRITKTIFLVMVIFVLFWLPWLALYSINLEVEPAWFTSLKHATVALYVANSAVNPWIYAYRSKGMRQAMLNIIKCKWNSPINLE